MKILAIETATDACSAALLIDKSVAQELCIAPREHAKIILPMVDQLLASAELRVTQLDVIAFGRGPGSFTGLRIATGIAQGIAFSANLPVAPVSTLAALALGCSREHQATHILTALDARKQEVYWGRYQLTENGLLQAQGAETVCPPERVALPDSCNWTGAGSGWGAYKEILQTRCGNRLDSVFPEQCPQAEDVARLAVQLAATGQLVPAQQAQPIYLRDNVADKPKPLR